MGTPLKSSDASLTHPGPPTWARLRPCPLRSQDGRPIRPDPGKSPELED